MPSTIPSQAAGNEQSRANGSPRRKVAGAGSGASQAGVSTASPLRASKPPLPTQIPRDAMARPSPGDGMAPGANKKPIPSTRASPRGALLETTPRASPRGAIPGSTPRASPRGAPLASPAPPKPRAGPSRPTVQAQYVGSTRSDLAAAARASQNKAPSKASPVRSPRTGLPSTVSPRTGLPSTVQKAPPSLETLPVASKDAGTEVSEAAMTNAIEASIERRV